MLSFKNVTYKERAKFRSKKNYCEDYAQSHM